MRPFQDLYELFMVARQPYQEGDPEIESVGDLEDLEKLIEGDDIDE